MALIFQEHSFGYRVVRGEGVSEHMLANVYTRRGVMGPGGLTTYEFMPYEQVTIHSAVGPLHLADLEEMMARVKADQRARLTKARQEAEAALAALPE